MQQARRPIWKADSIKTLLYRKNGNNYRLLAKTRQSFLDYRFSYGNKLYFSRGGEGRSCVTYSYTLGKSGFKKVGSVCLTSHSGKYAVGYLTLAGDAFTIFIVHDESFFWKNYQTWQRVRYQIYRWKNLLCIFCKQLHHADHTS